MISDPDFVSIDKRLTWFSSHIVTSRSNPFPGTSFAAPVAWRPATRPSRIREVRAMVSCHLATSRTHVTRVLVLVLASERRCERLSSSENTSPLIALTGTLPGQSLALRRTGLSAPMLQVPIDPFPLFCGGKGLAANAGRSPIPPLWKIPAVKRSHPSFIPPHSLAYNPALHGGVFFLARGLQGTLQGCAPF